MADRVLAIGKITMEQIDDFYEFAMETSQRIKNGMNRYDSKIAALELELGETRGMVDVFKAELEKATADNDALAEEVIEMGEARAAADERTAVVATQLLDSGICPKEADNSTCNRPCIDCWLSYLRGDGYSDDSFC